MLSVSGVEAGGRDLSNVKRKQEDKRREVKIVVIFFALSLYSF